MIQQADRYVSLILCPRLMPFKLKITNILKSRGWNWKIVIAMGTELCMAVGVLFVQLLAYQVSMVCAANWRSCCPHAVFFCLFLLYDCLRESLNIQQNT